MTTYEDEAGHDDIEREAEAYFQARRGWTWRRIMVLLIMLLLIAMMLVYVVLPALEFWATPLPNRPLLPSVNI